MYHSADANMGAASAFAALGQQCAAFNATGDYYDGLCTSSSSDAQLMTAIYQCVDLEGISSFNIDGMHQHGLCTGHKVYGS